MSMEEPFEIYEEYVSPDSRFSVEDDKQADWAIRKIKESREDTAKWRAYYADQIAKIEKANATTEDYFLAMLERYFAQVPHKATKTQESYMLPSGKLVRKAQNPTYERDDDALIAWAHASCPDVIRTKESVSWEQLKKRVTWSPDGEAINRDTGEIIPGVKAVKRDPVFHVTFTEVDEHG